MHDLIWEVKVPFNHMYTSLFVRPVRELSFQHDLEHNEEQDSGIREAFLKARHFDFRALW